LIANRELIKEKQGRWIPHETTMYDYSRNTHTVFRNYDIKIDPELHSSMFTPQFLKRGR
ncbi:MAG: outer membrane lipoprotein-sorting protein, partial [Flavobacterium sp.]|nr:outer membrane lipoprotein-sorting protein [Flavobacterium sp.]